MSSVNLKTVLRSHAEWILTACGLLIIGLVVWIMVWGVTVLAKNLGASLGTPRPQSSSDRFDLEAVDQLNLRGLE